MPAYNGWMTAGLYCKFKNFYTSRLYYLPVSSVSASVRQSSAAADRAAPSTAIIEYAFPLLDLVTPHESKTLLGLCSTAAEAGQLRR